MKFSQITGTLLVSGSAASIMLGADGHDNNMFTAPASKMMGGQHDYNRFTASAPTETPLLGGNHDYNTFTAEAPTSVPLLGGDHDNNVFTA